MENENNYNVTWAEVISRKKQRGSTSEVERKEGMGKTKDKQRVETVEGDVIERNKLSNNVRSKAKFQREYKKEATMIINVKDPANTTVMMIIKAVEKKIGIGKLIGLRKRTTNDFELTLENEQDCEGLMDGIEIDGQMCGAKKLCETVRMVSFLNLTNYIQDEDITDKLLMWCVTPLLPLGRRYYLGTTVANGTRYIRVKFPQDVVSLPFSTKFKTAEGLQFFLSNT